MHILIFSPFIAFKSSDDTEIAIDATETNHFPDDSVFKNLADASDFFETGAVGYSPNRERFEGLRLKAYRWEVRPLEVLNVKSSFFGNQEMFPSGSISFDNALLMTNIEHEWKSESYK
ncbi:MAG: hypothetical protein EOP48_31260 [Sphingobacteriales bacterium]|nr:MAG: hypothetical protein EOP48_31260 [Sphingobacteriales bacterium]